MPDLAGAKIAYLGFCGPIDSGGVTRLTAAINTFVNDQFDAIYLCLSSAGGYVGDGVYLYHHIRALPIDICLHNTGTCASIAATLFAAGKKRLASPNAIFMMHPVTVGAQTQQLSSEPLVSHLQAALAEEQRTESILRERTKLSDALLEARRRGELYFTAEKALEYGLIDSIAEFILPPGNKVFQI